jgi:ATP-dependent DNA helicase RecG
MQNAIIEYLKLHPNASRKEITAHISGITESGVKYNLKRLQDIGMIKRVGPAKGGHWVVIE